MNNEFFCHALHCLDECNVLLKIPKVHDFRKNWSAGKLAFSKTVCPATRIAVPGRPEKPEMVAAHAVFKRNLGTLQGRAAFIHALAHIEFNAINLALDAIYRFRDMPREFYDDWLRVAAEEASHFMLLQDYLHTQGYAYGDFTAHNGLWEMAVATDHDPLVRMALVPRVLEARGLDVLPGIMHKLVSCGEKNAVSILQTILDDEIGHVAIGNRWYHYLCQQRGLEPLTTFRNLLVEYKADKFSGPFHTEARLAAGFSREELEMLENSLQLPDSNK